MDFSHSFELAVILLGRWLDKTSILLGSQNGYGLESPTRNSTRAYRDALDSTCLYLSLLLYTRSRKQTDEIYYPVNSLQSL